MYALEDNVDTCTSIRHVYTSYLCIYNIQLLYLLQIIANVGSTCQVLLESKVSVCVCVLFVIEWVFVGAIQSCCSLLEDIWRGRACRELPQAFTTLLRSHQ